MKKEAATGVQRSQKKPEQKASILSAPEGRDFIYDWHRPIRIAINVADQEVI